MSAFVIDDKKKRQYLAVFVVSIIISFALGFTSGYFTNLSPSSQSYDQLKSELFGDSAPAGDDASQQRASDVDEPRAEENPDADKTDDNKESDEKEVQGKTPVKKTETGAREAAPEKQSASTRSSVRVAERKPPAPRAKPVTVSATRPVAKPEPKPAPKPRAVEKAESGPKPEPVPEPKPEPVEQPARLQAEQTSAPTRPPEENLAPTRPPVTDSAKLPVAYVPEEQTRAPVSAEDDSAASGETRRHYAVQVGMFANRDNAQKLVYELVDDGYDAYMDEFTASDGALKYNVRFGRFADRASVQSRLADYKREYASPAYIIITK